MNSITPPNLSLPTARDVKAGAAMAGMEISALLKEANVSRSTFRRWERGDDAIRLATVGRLIDVVRTHLINHKRSAIDG